MNQHLWQQTMISPKPEQDTTNNLNLKAAKQSYARSLIEYNNSGKLKVTQHKGEYKPDPEETQGVIQKVIQDHIDAKNLPYTAASNDKTHQGNTAAT